MVPGDRYMDGARARHIKLRMRGAARWFAIEAVGVFEQVRASER